MSWTTARFHDIDKKDPSCRRGPRFWWIFRCQARTLHGTPCRSEDLEGHSAGQRPEYKKGEPQKYLPLNFGCGVDRPSAIL